MRKNPCHCPQGTSHQLSLTSRTCLQQSRGLLTDTEPWGITKAIQEQPHIQQHGSTAPIHWGGSKASPSHAGCYAGSLLELSASNIQRDKQLKMKKLLVAGVPTVCSDVHLLSTLFSYYPSGGERWFPRKRSWQELSITGPDLPLVPQPRNSGEVLAHSQAAEVSSLQSQEHTCWRTECMWDSATWRNCVTCKQFLAQRKQLKFWRTRWSYTLTHTWIHAKLILTLF